MPLARSAWLRAWGLAVIALAISTFVTAGPAHADVTGASEDLRTGWYPDEPLLSPARVASGHFEKTFEDKLQGQIYAQPLIANGTLLVVTEDDWAYGLDPVTGAVRWQRAVGTPANASEKPWCTDLTPHFGITGTPVIDTQTNTAYFAADEYVAGSVTWRMHAIDLASGQEVPNFPVKIEGVARNLHKETVAFTAAKQLQRPALLMLGGVVYAAFGSHCDENPYQGWIAGVSTVSGKLTTMWATSGHGGSIWQSGGGLVSDRPGQILFSSGNDDEEPGTWDPAPGEPASEAGANGKLGESVVRVEAQPEAGELTELTTRDYFSPFDSKALDEKDLDVASSAPVGLPSPYFGNAGIPHLLVQEGKAGSFYLLNRDALGGRGSSNAVVQELTGFGAVFGAAAVWPGEGGYVDIPSRGHLHFFRYGESSGKPALVSETMSSEEMSFGSGSPIVSSSGTTSGTGVLWVNWCPQAGCTEAQAELRAYNPVGGVAAKPFWREKIGLATKFSRPGVSNGHIYVGNLAGQIIGFSAPTLTPSSESLQLGSAAVGGQLKGQLTLTNTGTPLTVKDARTPSSPFSATGLPAPGAVVKPGQVITVEVTFSSSSPGSFTGSLGLTTEAGEMNIALSASAASPPPAQSNPPASGSIVTTASLIAAAAPPVIATEVLPILSHLKIRAAASRLGSHRRKLAISYTLSTADTVEVEVYRRVTGHSCARRVRVCARWVLTKIKLKVSGQPGSNSLSVNLGTLAAGRYRLAATPGTRSHTRALTRYVEFKTPR